MESSLRTVEILEKACHDQHVPRKADSLEWNATSGQDVYSGMLYILRWSEKVPSNGTLKMNLKVDDILKMMP